MSEKIQVLARRNLDRSPSPRDVAAVFFRHSRLLAVSFVLVLAAGLMYAVLAPSYEAEMKVLVRRGRIDPAVTPTQTTSPAFEHDEISEEELNSEVLRKQSMRFLGGSLWCETRDSRSNLLLTGVPARSTGTPIL